MIVFFMISPRIQPLRKIKRIHKPSKKIKLKEVKRIFWLDYKMKTPFRIQYASQLFVDAHSIPFQKLVRPPSVATPYLALCGNIGNPFHPRTYDFLRYCSEHWKHTFWVPSTTELSGQGEPTPYYKYADQALEITQKIRGITFMNQGQAEFPKHQVILLGASLWSSFHGMQTIHKGAPEFQDIWMNPSEGKKMNEKSLSNWHNEDREFLRGQINFSRNWKGVRVVLLTHTLPTPWIVSRGLDAQTYKRAPLDVIDDETRRKLYRPPVRLWLGGAMGSCKTGLIDGVFCGVNGRWENRKAAEQEHENPVYLPTLFAEIPENQDPDHSFPNSSKGLGLPIPLPYLLAHQKGKETCVSNLPAIFI